jgi:GMP synthase (glutamine-hydrolysing)
LSRNATRRAVAIRHVAFEDLGTLAGVLDARGFAIQYLEAGRDGLAEAGDPDLLVALGGPIGAYEDESYPFVAEEARLIAKRLTARRPTLGICLGAQLMARALGARVYPSGIKEIGWGRLDLTRAGRASPLAPLGEPAARVLHWHGDTFDLPDGANLLASTGACVNQAFAIGGFALALQFHLEVETANLARWFVGHAVEVAAAKSAPLATLRADTARYGPALERTGAACLDGWLEAQGL